MSVLQQLKQAVREAAFGEPIKHRSGLTIRQGAPPTADVYPVFPLELADKVYNAVRRFFGRGTGWDIHYIGDEDHQMTFSWDPDELQEPDYDELERELQKVDGKIKIVNREEYRAAIVYGKD